MTKKRVISKRMITDPSKIGERRPTSSRTVGSRSRDYQGTGWSQWNCSECGRTGIPGNVKKCPGCGANKEHDEEYHAPTTPQIVNEQELRQYGVDPRHHFSDEECKHCGAKLQPGTTSCPNCGASIDNTAYTDKKCASCGTEYTGVQCPRCGSDAVVGQSVPPRPHQSRSKPFSLPTKPSITIPPNAGLIALIALGFFALVFFGWLILRPKIETAMVSDVYWERTINRQEYQYVNREGWSLPSDADVISTEERVHHYDQVLDHYEEECHWEQELDGYDEECRWEEECEYYEEYVGTEETCYDDGSCDYDDIYETRSDCKQVEVCQDVPRYRDVEVCEDVPVYRDVPVYAKYYLYKRWEWISISSVTASEHSNIPHWPDQSLSENRRENGRSEKLVVTFTGKRERTYTYKPASVEEFGNFRLGSSWEIKRNALVVTEILGRSE